MTLLSEGFKTNVIKAGFVALQASQLSRLTGARGLGAILMFHHVRPWGGQEFAPNRGLEITPDYLDAALTLLRDKGYAIVSLDEAEHRIRGGASEPPFAALTFDDGYRDNLAHALPVLERHAAPFTLYVTTGYADRSARLWWIELEEAIRRANALSFEGLLFSTRTGSEKTQAFRTIYWALRNGPEARLLDSITAMQAQAGVVSRDLVEALCLDWAEIEALSRHPLCTIGVHTLTHPMLAKHGEAVVRRELTESRDIIEARIGRAARHLAYPVGDSTSAGSREFALAAELGFATGVTTRKGMVFPEHAGHLTALPRLSVSGAWQDLGVLDTLLSGLPFLLLNRGRRVAA